MRNPVVPHRLFSTSERATVRLLLVAVLLVAFALRVYHLDFQSLESDEGISLQRSGQPLGQMLARMPVEHVPGYFVLLNGWLRVAGETDFALRYFSVLPSVAAVALGYRWAASMGRPWIGVIAAVLLAMNSFQVWYAQQARMYSWLLMTSLFSFWSLWRMVAPLEQSHAVMLSGAKPPSASAHAHQRDPSQAQGDKLSVMLSGAKHLSASATVSFRRNDRHADLVYVLSTAATVYLHYFGFLIPVAQTVFMLVWTLVGGAWRDKVRSATLRWVVNGALVFLLFLPWLPKTITFLGFQGWREPLDPWQVPWLMHRAYSVGLSTSQPWQVWLPWLYLAMAVVGMGVWWRWWRSAAWLLLAATVLPASLILVAVLRNPDFHERYSMFLAAPWLLLIAGGTGVLLPLGAWLRLPNRVVWLGGALTALLVTGLVVFNGLALERLYFDTTLHKPNYRSAALRIYEHGAPGDVVLADGINPDLVFNHYYQDTFDGQAPVVDLRPLADKDYDQVSAALAEVTVGADRVWEVLYFRAPGLVQLWLAQNGWSSAPTDHNGIRVTLYGLDRGPLVEQAVATPFGEGLTLVAAGVDGPTVQPGDLLRVTTRWQVDAPLPDYKFSLRLAAQDGQVIIADDYVPQNWFAPTSQWAVGEARDQRALLLPAALPAGVYLITLRLYDPVNGVPVETPASQDVRLGTVHVE